MKTADFLTVGELTEACNQNRFLLCWTAHGNFFGLNGQISSISSKGKDIDSPTKVVGYMGCSFMEYITYKTPFILTPSNSIR